VERQLADEMRAVDIRGMYLHAEAAVTACAELMDKTGLAYTFALG